MFLAIREAAIHLAVSLFLLPQGHQLVKLVITNNANATVNTREIILHLSLNLATAPTFKIKKRIIFIYVKIEPMISW
jgi:hypothetical protein